MAPKFQPSHPYEDTDRDRGMTPWEIRYTLRQGLFSTAFWLDSGERAIKAFAGGLATGFGSNAVDLDVFQASALKIVERSALLAATSIVFSIVSAPKDGISPASLVPHPGA